MCVWIVTGEESAMGSFVAPMESGGKPRAVHNPGARFEHRCFALAIGLGN